MRWLALVAGVALAGCATVEPIEVPTRVQAIEETLPPAKAFTRAFPSPPGRSNANIAADFVSLHFALEGGAQLPVFTRFETPITLRLTGAPTPSMQRDLTQLLNRLHREAGIDIRQVSEGTANITIEAVSQAQIHEILPQAACFVVPNSSSFEEYRRDRRKQKSSWSRLRSRERLGIFIPYDVSPQEKRDCLHEEIAQALGPLNDLYHLPDSVFNDDNIHTVLTGFDMLILRTAYAPELRSGMTREQVEAALPGILSRLNPRGDTLPARPVSETPREWINAVQKSLRPQLNTQRRLRAAKKAARIGQEEGWTDHRRAYPYYLMGRMGQFDNPQDSLRDYQTALKYLRATPGTEIHQAYITTQTAAFALALGKGPEALPELDKAINVMTRAENASQLATLLLLKSEALNQAGRTAEARSVRLDSLGWARYGFGSETVVRSLSQDVAEGPPNNNRGG
ncbi:hypothetical protein RUE5091_00756 [Ruegeria denitrificans]|uniref:ATP-dependent transcriptional regulator n=1 Tax=Ruegeria denitrificans TaxID=1715692 RepID=A0A0P1IFU5_9RHOB|nr:DUF2927 domain-containing protein [Ruegeria denitrificans]CUJ88726.1 hypothetical protein RUE5091_00756 [Ruegeria denitrificans]